MIYNYSNNSVVCVCASRIIVEEGSMIVANQIGEEQAYANEDETNR